jgi:hypothetical protein
MDPYVYYEVREYKYNKIDPGLCIVDNHNTDIWHCASHPSLSSYCGELEGIGVYSSWRPGYQHQAETYILVTDPACTIMEDPEVPEPGEPERP